MRRPRNKRGGLTPPSTSSRPLPMAWKLHAYLGARIGSRLRHRRMSVGLRLPLDVISSARKSSGIVASRSFVSLPLVTSSRSASIAEAEDIATKTTARPPKPLESICLHVFRCTCKLSATADAVPRRSSSPLLLFAANVRERYAVICIDRFREERHALHAAVLGGACTELIDYLRLLSASVVLASIRRGWWLTPVANCFSSAL